MKFLRYLEKNFEEAFMGILLIGMSLILMAQILIKNAVKPLTSATGI